MSHRLGRIVPVGVRIGPDSGAAPTSAGVWTYNMAVGAALVGGPPCFVMLHFASAVFSTGATIKVDVGYDVDLFGAGNGVEFWSRPIDPNRFAQTITVSYSGTMGGVTLTEYGSGEPIDSDEFNYPVGGFEGSHSDPDVFLHSSPYIEPIYETRLACHSPFTWSNAAAAQTAAEKQAVAATGIIMMTETYTPQHPVGPLETCVSSCTGTLIGPDLFLTARHCATDADGADILSSSVTFDYQTDKNGNRPGGYNPHWYKVIGVVAAGASPTQYSFQADTDWLLLRLDTGAAGIPITPCDLRSGAIAANEPAFTVHHPGGAVKKFQKGAVVSGDVHNVTGFDYAGGSSGSALFDANAKVIGAALSAGPIANACNVGYSRASGVTTALANPPVPAAPWDVMVVIDRSGSMSGPGGNGQTKLVEAQQAASLFVQLIRTGAGDTLGLDTFSTSATIPAGGNPSAVDAARKNTLVGGAPYTGGLVGAVVSAGVTSIGDGLKKAVAAFPAPHGGSQRAILLLTDGLENWAPMIHDVEGSLGGIRLFVVGYGDDANLNGPLLTKLARDHGGWYVRADHGLALKKLFGLSFGNIFQSGALTDPEYHIAAGDLDGVTIPCRVCDETELTAIVGWDRSAGALTVRFEAPDGTVIDSSSPGVTSDMGATWSFVRLRLPYGTNRSGTWKVHVVRAQAKRKKEPIALDYFVSVVADGGPKLQPLVPTQLVDVGDPLPVLVGLQYPDRTVPELATVEVAVTGPKVSLTDLVAQQPAAPAAGGADPVNSWTATLQQLAAANGGVLPVPTFTKTVRLFDDGMHKDGAMESDGIFGATLNGLTKCDGTYDFHAVATYGDACQATREAFWSVTVGLKDDPYANPLKSRPRGEPNTGRQAPAVQTAKKLAVEPAAPGAKKSNKPAAKKAATAKKPAAKRRS
jgi:hypothetical protein